VARAIYPVNRRNALQLGITALVGSSGLTTTALAADAIEDSDIFQFALNLEYMETEYYLRATTGEGMSAADAGSGCW
jgi:hypothetical protein